MSPKLKIISTETIHQNPWWSYKHDKLLLPNGKEGNYYYGETSGSGSSMVVPILDDGRLLLTTQHRYLRDKLSVEFPCGGLLNTDETPPAAAGRELMEETGYKAGELIMVGTYEGLNGLFKDTTHVFIAKELEKVREPMIDDNEEVETLLRRPDEFDDMIRRGEIWDGQTLAAWAMVRERAMEL